MAEKGLLTFLGNSLISGCFCLDVQSWKKELKFDFLSLLTWPHASDRSVVVLLADMVSLDLLQF